MRRASSFISSLARNDSSAADLAEQGSSSALAARGRRGKMATRPGGSGKPAIRDPKATRKRRVFVRRLRAALLLVAALAALRLVALLATWYPGDETIRASSEGPLRLMFSRSGLSFGTRREVHFRGEVKIDADDGAIKKTSRGYTVQGKIAKHPKWTRDLNVTAYAESALPAPRRPSSSSSSSSSSAAPNRSPPSSCFFRVHRDEPRVTFFDDGRVIVRRLGSVPSSGGGGGDTEKNAADADADAATALRCEHFCAATAAALEPPGPGGASPRRLEAPATAPDGDLVGRALMMNSATTLDMLSEYHRTLLNHQTYAEDRGYGFVLSIVRPSSLEGRSGKFAKHLAMGAHLARARRAPDARDEWDSVCHTDLDAWHASWAPLSAYGEAYWAKDRDVLFGDSGQIWINSGLMCARPTARAVAFFERVVNAVFTGADPGDATAMEAERAAGEALIGAGGVKYGFKRDQPAVWHVLSQIWAASDARVPYKAQACDAWHRACNPDENPIECWHWCHWDALQRRPGGWAGLADVNALGFAQLAPRAEGPGGGGALPPMHRMCLRSCRSVLSRAGMGLCGLVTGGAQACYPADVDKMSLCDGAGCLAQMQSHGGGWIKHTGHQHWRDRLPSCVPTTEEEATRERGNHLALCD